MPYTNLSLELKTAVAAVDKAKRLPCTCDAFDIYTGEPCTCQRSKTLALAENQLRVVQDAIRKHNQSVQKLKEKIES